jgi:hypothetical protein
MYLEIAVPNIRTVSTTARTASKLISGLKPFITGLKAVSTFYKQKS